MIPTMAQLGSRTDESKIELPASPFRPVLKRRAFGSPGREKNIQRRVPRSAAGSRSLASSWCCDGRSRLLPLFVFAWLGVSCLSAEAQQPLWPSPASGPPPSLRGGNCDDLSGLPIQQNVTWDQVWTALDASASCTQNCHIGADAAGALDLSSRDFSIYGLVGQASSQSQTLRVVPGDPAASLLQQKVSCPKPAVGQRMPAVGRLSRELQGLIYDWIEQGALGEPSEDPIARDYLFRASYESLRSE